MLAPLLGLFKSRKDRHALASIVGVVVTCLFGERLGLTPEQVVIISGALVTLGMGLIGGVAHEDAALHSAGTHPGHPGKPGNLISSIELTTEEQPPGPG